MELRYQTLVTLKHFYNTYSMTIHGKKRNKPTIHSKKKTIIKDITKHKTENDIFINLACPLFLTIKSKHNYYYNWTCFSHEKKISHLPVYERTN